MAIHQLVNENQKFGGEVRRIWTPIQRESLQPEGIGIGVITYNRLSVLQECIEAIRKTTTLPYYLVVGDDGSSDGSASWCRESNIPVVTGKNQGCAWNKNRVLKHLMAYTTCDPIIIIEEDCIPDTVGWDKVWTRATHRWGHVNFAKADLLRDCYIKGEGRPDSPYWLNYMTGQVQATSREALSDVGALDPRFVGWGDEHVEWTNRFATYFGWGKWNTPAINYGFKMADVDSHFNNEQWVKNQQLRWAIEDSGTYRFPYVDSVQKARMIHEQKRSLWSTHEELSDRSIVSVIVPTRTPKLAKKLLNSLSSGPREVIWVWNGEGNAPTWMQNSGTVVEYREPEFSYEEAINRGAQAARGSIYVIVNDDVEITCSNLWGQLLKTYDFNPKLGALYGGQVGEWRFNEDATAPFWDGACWAISAKAFKRMGGLEESVREYGGDELITRIRMKRLGYIGGRLQGWTWTHDWNGTYGQGVFNTRHMKSVCSALGWHTDDPEPTIENAKTMVDTIIRGEE